MFNPLVLFKAPEINPINKKAKSIPALNPINVYGRVFNFAWIGFFLAFLSWFAWAPLIADTIKQDLKLSQNEIANSNIVGLTATLIIRAISGPLCDKFGPRKVFAGLLLVGALPTLLSFTIKNAGGLIAIRFFVGILGGTFVPCQVWTTGFFDKNVIGTANSFTGGFGNTGGGVTYFVMPAFYNVILEHYHVSAHWAWRDAFFLPFALITTWAILMLLLCPDTPTGKWSERTQAVQSNLQHEHAAGHVVVQSGIGDTHHHGHADSPQRTASDPEKAEKLSHDGPTDVSKGDVIVVDEEYNHEVIQSPTFKEIIKVVMSPQTLALMAWYFNSFGAELSVNSILGAYYLKNFPYLNQTSAGRWAAIFGTQNFIGRPLGGMISDLLYKYTGGSLWAKKILIHVCGLLMGMFLIIIGALNTHDRPLMVGLVFCLGLFMDAGNGANFSLVPHVHPYANGIVSGFVGAAGNFGGIIGAIIFRYNGVKYGKSIWILGIICIVMHLLTIWIKPIPKGQIGGR